MAGRRDLASRHGLRALQFIFAPREGASPTASAPGDPAIEPDSARHVVMALAPSIPILFYDDSLGVNRVVQHLGRTSRTDAPGHAPSSFGVLACVRIGFMWGQPAVAYGAIDIRAQSGSRGLSVATSSTVLHLPESLRTESAARSLTRESVGAMKFSSRVGAPPSA